MKRLALIFVLCFTAIVAQAQYFTGFSVVSYRITSAWPTSLRSVRGNVAATVSNTGDTRTMSEITATVYRNGRRFAHGTCEDVTFFQGTRNYTLKGRVQLADGVSTWDAILAALSFNVAEYTLDFSITIRHADGSVDNVVRTGRALSDYLHRK